MVQHFDDVEYIRDRSPRHIGEYYDDVAAFTDPPFSIAAGICVLSSYKESFIIDIQPQKELHPRVLWLSFWAEVHYNSLYPSGA